MSRPRLYLIADVPDWIFARHCRELTARLADEFDCTTGMMGEPFDEQDYDLIYPLEWNLVEPGAIADPQRYVTGIRGHTSWRQLPFEDIGELLRERFGAVHAVSRRLQRLFAPMVPGIELVCHGVDTEHFRPRQPASERGSRLRLGWGGNRLAYQKCYERLIRPLADIPGVELCVRGIHYHNLTLEQMPSFYEAIDAYVCPSLNEGCSNAVLEAAAMERAIVTTDTGNAGEYLTDGESALFVEPELDAVVAAVECLRDHPALRRELGSAARRAVEATMSWSRRAEDYRRFFRAALEARNSAPAHALSCRSTPAG